MIPPVVVDIFSLLCVVAGWFYLVHSKAAGRMGRLEPAAINNRRIALRRLCGCAMLLLGAGFFAGCNLADPRRRPALFLALWLSVLTLLALVVVLALADVRLTWKLREQIRRGGPS
ncbi:MAG: hypothetical protein ABR964_16065 [Tepidisphaeraceae bacterium]|jgi:Na+/H+ antiporter NhaD/arsenite permease-like protein